MKNALASTKKKNNSKRKNAGVAAIGIFFSHELFGLNLSILLIFSF